MYNNFNFGYTYIEQDDEVKHNLRIQNKILTIIYKLACAYEWEVDCNMPAMILESILTTHGMIGTKDGIDIGWLVPAGTWTRAGLPSKYTITYLDGTSEELPAEELEVCYNGYRFNKSDIYLAEIAGEMLANIDLSEVCNIIYSRNLPIPVVDNDVDKDQIKNIIKNAIKGNIDIVSKNLISKFKMGQDLEPITLLPLFNVNSSENLQDLSRFCEAIEKRLLAERGINIGSIDKKAQITEDELNNMNEYAALSVADLTRCRQDFCDRVNKRFGKNWSVRHIHDIIKEEEIEEAEELQEAEDNLQDVEDTLNIEENDNEEGQKDE